MRIRQLSGGILFFTLAIYAGWDLFAYSSGGADATFSGLISDWLRIGGVSVFLAGVATGMVTAHLIGWTKR